MIKGDKVEGKDEEDLDLFQSHCYLSVCVCRYVCKILVYKIVHLLSLGFSYQLIRETQLITEQNKEKLVSQEHLEC